MNIASTQLSVANRSKAPQTGQSAPAEKKKVEDTAHKPALDWWEINGEQYESTPDFLANIPAEGGKATYRFLQTAPKDFVPSKLGPDMAAGAALGAVGGGAVIGGLTFMGNAMGELAYFLTLGFGGRPETVGLSMSALGMAVGVGAVVGAGLAAYKNKAQKAPVPLENAETRTGTVRQEGDKTIFYLNNDLESGVDLNKFAQASELPEPVTPEGGGRKGWATGLGLAFASTVVPPVGMFAPTIVSSQLGSDLSGGKLHGRILGGVAGAAATAAVYSATGATGVAPFLAATLGAGVLAAGVGALVGPIADANQPKVIPGLKEQWWAGSAVESY